VLPVKRKIETHLRHEQEFALGHAETVGVLILFGQRGMEHRRIIGGKHYGDPVPKERGERMIFDSGGGTAQL
jgi:hypothetical protein